MMHFQNSGVGKVLRGGGGDSAPHRHDEVLRMRWPGEWACLKGAPRLINLKGKLSVRFMGPCRLMEVKGNAQRSHVDEP